MEICLMSNEIFHITIKHKIYEWCIDVVFNYIFKNFPSKAKRVPHIGEKYVSIHHINIDEIYFNCTIVDPKKLEDYDLMDDIEIADMIFAISYKKAIYNTEDGEEIEIFDSSKDEEDRGYQYFLTDDMEYLEFKQ